MTIFSAQQIFSEDQAITATAASTNILDLGVPATPILAGGALVRDIGKGMPLHILVQVTADFNTLTSLTVDLEVDDNTGFSSSKIINTQSILLADLVAGKQTFMQFVPNGADERYIRMNYTVVGTPPTLGTITAGITMGNQTNV